jgi:hypothetical protein
MDGELILTEAQVAERRTELIDLIAWKVVNEGGEDVCAYMWQTLGLTRPDYAELVNSPDFAAALAKYEKAFMLIPRRREYVDRTFAQAGAGDKEARKSVDRLYGEGETSFSLTQKVEAKGSGSAQEWAEAMANIVGLAHDSKRAGSFPEADAPKGIVQQVLPVGGAGEPGGPAAIEDGGGTKAPLPVGEGAREQLRVPLQAEPEAEPLPQREVPDEDVLRVEPEREDDSADP